MWTYVSSDALYHHGIKGQRWGVRRFQNEDGSLTAAGRRRYDVDIEGAKQRVADAKASAKRAQKEYQRKSLGGLIINKQTKELNARANKEVKKVNWEKENLQSEKVKNRLNSEKNKSSHRLKLEEQYRSKGMSDEEAAIAAYKRERTERIISATAAVGIAAAASYVAYRHYDRSVDKIIKSDTIMKRVTSSDTKSVRDGFYATLNEKDSQKYVGIFGSSLLKEGDAFQKSIRVNAPIKVASEKSAIEALSDLVKKDPEYARTLKRDLENFAKDMNDENATPKQINAVKQGLKSLSKGKIDSKVYTALNVDFINKDQSTKKFYDYLTSKGYDAVGDINDKRISGFMAKTPTVVLNSSKTTVERVRKLGEQEVARAKASGNMDIAIKAFTPTMATFAGGAVVINKGQKMLQSKQRDKIVSDYRKEHPDTNLSYNEILRNYYNN